MSNVSNNKIKFLNGWPVVTVSFINKVMVLFVSLFCFILINSEYLMSLSNSNKKPYLWVYWENLNGSKMPAHISLSRKTLIKNCSNSFNIVELDEKNIDQYIPNLKNIEEALGINNLIIQKRVDVYRVLLLYLHGGFYIDSDMIVMKDLKEITDKLEKYDYVGFGPREKIRNWAMASRPQGAFITVVLRDLVNILSKKKLSRVIANYGELGIDLLNSVLSRLVPQGYTYYHYSSLVDGTTDAYGNKVTTAQIFSNRPLKYKNPDQLLFVFYINHSLSKKFLKFTEKDFLSKNTNFALFIKKSLGINN